MIQTTRLAMPLLVAGQSQKELHHNEALLLADLLLCPVVEGMPSPTPPPSPVPGQCFIVGAAATGDWTGHDGKVAGWTEAGWLFTDVPEGSVFRNRTSGSDLVKTGGAWEAGVLHASEVRVGGLAVLKGQQASIAPPTGGTTVDSQSRSTIASILAALRAHGLIAT